MNHLRFVLTGGPGAGKTVISRFLAQKYPDRLVLVPEAATQVYDALQTRWDRLDVPGRRDVQRRIYRLQVDQENQLGQLCGEKSLLLDRGTIDGAVYWPEGPADYWKAVGSDRDCELRRYDMVIWMQSGAALGLYDGDSSNPRRHESPIAAITSGERLAELWRDHPRFHVVPAFHDLADKIAEVEKLLFGKEAADWREKSERASSAHPNL